MLYRVTGKARFEYDIDADNKAEAIELARETFDWEDKPELELYGLDWEANGVVIDSRGLGL